MKNEWHLIIEVLETIQTSTEVSFAVIKSKNTPEESFVGTLMDNKGREYEILIDESENLEYALLAMHDLEIVHDHKNETITFQKEDIVEKVPGTQYKIW